MQRQRGWFGDRGLEADCETALRQQICYSPISARRAAMHKLLEIRTPIAARWATPRQADSIDSGSGERGGQLH